MGKGDKDIKTTDMDGAEAKAPSVATPAEKPRHIVSDDLKLKVNLLIPDNTGRRDKTLRALEAGKTVYIGAHKLRAAKAE
jgi:hypothetical protein